MSVGCNTLLLPADRRPVRSRSRRNRCNAPDLQVRTLGSKHPGTAAPYTRTRRERHPPCCRLAAKQACDCDSLPHPRGGCNGGNGEGGARRRGPGRDNARLDFDMGPAHLIYQSFKLVPWSRAAPALRARVALSAANQAEAAPRSTDYLRKHGRCARPIKGRVFARPA
jgi:hypothetical protein